MKMAGKLGAGFGVVVVMLLVVGAVGIVSLNSVNRGYQVDVLGIEELRGYAERLEIEVLQARRSEKDFLARQDLQYAEKVKQALDGAREAASNIETKARNEKLVQEARGAIKKLAAYGDGFQLLVKASEERGLNETMGAQGSFRTAVHNLDKMLQQYDTANIALWALTARRYEKDILLNAEDATSRENYYRKLRTAIDKLKAVTGESGLDEAQKNKFLSLVKQYDEAMAAMADAVRGGGARDYDRVREASHQIEAFVNGNSIEDGDVLYLELRKEEKDYMLRGDKKYMERSNKVAGTLTTRINESQLAAADKASMLALLTTYQNNFKQMVDKDEEIKVHLGKMKEHADGALEMVETLEGVVDQEAVQTVARIDSSASGAIWLMVATSAVCSCAAIIFALFFARSISVPMRRTVKMLKELELGHLKERLKLKRADEIGEMATTLDAFADNLQNETVAILKGLANGDVTYKIEPRDAQDEIRNALKQLGDDLNQVLGQIQLAGEQINSGASQVSDGAQDLSQGATESAASLEEITSSMAELSGRTRGNAENAGQADRLSKEAMDAARSGSDQMQQMVAAMDDIRESGQSISKIIKVIDEIAFQTNLLALNAAVEAARAGQHGKGFAVVAEEVRNLAARSAKAAQETAELIEGSVQKTENGANIARATAEALANIVSSITKTSDLVAEISMASNEQSQGIGQINQGLEQIDKVTQSNTANAEESAAAAEELSGQALEMNRLLQQFKLRESIGAGRHAPVSAGKQVALSAPSKREGWQMEAGQASGSTAEMEIALDDSEFGKY